MQLLLGRDRERLLKEGERHLVIHYSVANALLKEKDPERRRETLTSYLRDKYQITL